MLLLIIQNLLTYVPYWQENKTLKKITDKRKCWFSDSNFDCVTNCPAGGIIPPGKFRNGFCDRPIPRPEESLRLCVCH
jgi:hypothetical protein